MFKFPRQPEGVTGARRAVQLTSFECGGKATAFVAPTKNGGFAQLSSERSEDLGAWVARSRQPGTARPQVPRSRSGYNLAPAPRVRPAALATTITINNNQMIVAESLPFVVTGTTDARPALPSR